MTSFLYACIAGLLLTAGTEAGRPKKPRKIRDLINKGPQHVDKTHKNTRTNYQFAHASCKVNARSYSSSYSRDGFAKAVANVAKNVCYYGWDYKHVKDHMFDYAKAVARASAEVWVDCKSAASEDGYASGCGYGKASADAIASAWAEAYASASAEITNEGWYCCKNPEIWTSAHASLWQEITAKAWAEAEAAACTEANDGVDRAWAHAAVDCYASVWTGLYAKAWAKIYIDAGCYGSDRAKAEVDAWVSSFSIEKEKCRIKLKSSDNAGADGKGHADADS